MIQRLLYVLTVAICISPASGQQTQPKLKTIGYFPGWSGYGSAYSVADVPGDKLTHVIYSFANISESGEIAVGDVRLDVEGINDRPGQFEQFAALKKRHPKLRCLICVGGWTWSERFSDMAATPQSRRRFAKSAVIFLRKYKFDGIDIDWEFPVKGGEPDNRHRPEDKQNLTLLIQELKQQFAAEGRGWTVTAAIDITPAHYSNLDLKGLGTHADWLHLMAYNMHGTWSNVTNFHTALHPVRADPNAPAVKAGTNIAAAIDEFIRQGVPARKLVVGGALYGRVFRGVTRDENGLFQEFDSTSTEPSGIPFREITALKKDSWKRHWNREARVPWLFNSKERVMITYDDSQSLREKAKFVRDRKLGGMMLWSLSSDDKEHSLVNTVYDVLK